MKDKVFIDTNILVYAFDSTAGMKHERAKSLIADIWESGAGCLSIQVLQEFYVTVTKKVAVPLPLNDAADLVVDFTEWNVHSPQVKDILGAVKLQQETGISFWDSMIIQSAMSKGCRVLYSEDLNHGQTIKGLEIVNPFIS